VKVLLVSTYELGHQPLGVAAPAGVLRARGHDVRTLDLAVQPWDAEAVEWAERVACSVPMHTAARLAREVAGRIADRPVACFGLYAAMCADAADALVGRDPVTALVEWVEGAPPIEIEPARPARDLLPPVVDYARLVDGGRERVAGSVDASFGCAHRCRHCPVPVVYDGRIRVVDVDSVVADVAQQVEAGVEHITFGDPDFFNGVHHSRRVVDAIHTAFPDLTFDCTVKVEHVLRHADVWPELAARGCRFVVSAFESADDAILARLDKGHTVADEIRAVEVLRAHGIPVRPTWLPFTPWSTEDTVRDIFELVRAHGLVGNVDPVQYTIRLLVPEGSLLLGHVEGLGPWDPDRLAYPWSSPLDGLQEHLARLVEDHADAPALETTNAVRGALGLDPVAAHEVVDAPRLSEPWFCCAEPTATQLRGL
jgi:radical SAM superfamily enzyme YgiQ (UPF0313 family)